MKATYTSQGLRFEVEQRPNQRMKLTARSGQMQDRPPPQAAAYARSVRAAMRSWESDDGS